MTHYTSHNGAIKAGEQSKQSGKQCTTMKVLFCTIIALTFSCFAVTADTRRHGDLANPDKQNIRLVESERVDEYYNRNYTWPVSRFVPDTPGWKRLMSERFAQVSELDGSLKRYEGYIQTVHTAFLVPNFTEYGFGLARCPDELIGTLRKAIRDGLPTAKEEVSTQVINGPQRPLFVERPDLTDRVLQEMRPYAEEWSGMELTPYRAYGFRLYRNESQLTMHVDKVCTAPGRNQNYNRSPLAKAHNVGMTLHCRCKRT